MRVVALVFVTILGGILGSLRTFLFTETTNRIDTRLGAEVIDHLLKLPLNYFDSSYEVCSATKQSKFDETGYYKRISL